MRALALGALLAVPAAGCGAAAPLVTVDQLLGQCEALKGKAVRVAGYIDGCGGRDCSLYADKAGAAATAKFLGDASREARLANREGRSATIGAVPSSIGIGWTEAFDRKAKGFQRSYVVISGRVDDKNCTGAGGTDRSHGVFPTDIRTWTPSEGAPANTH